MMFCSDDKHPDSLAFGHINKICSRAVSEGYDVFKVLQAACINPVKHYALGVGLLRNDDPADFIVVNNLQDFNVYATYIDGIKVAENGNTLIKKTLALDQELNAFNIGEISLDELVVKETENYELPVIECLDGQLITPKLYRTPKKMNGQWVSDVEADVLKIVVVNRYAKRPIAKAFIHRFGLKQGAIASSVAHDSHNIVAVGVDDESILRAVNLIIQCKGGVSCVSGNKESVLPLPIGGLMSGDDGYVVAANYTEIDLATKAMGSTLSAPFMSLSFMALLVIPHVKLSDKGLFDGDSFSLY
jgi:adenine deaminase